MEDNMMQEENDWFDDFLVEVSELESTLKCPSCGEIHMIHSSPFRYLFICGYCNFHYNYPQGKYEKELELLDSTLAKS